MFSCTDDFTELNTNEKVLTLATIKDDELLLGQVFAQAQYGSMFDSPFYFQYAQNWSSDLYSQYFAICVSYAEPDRNDFTDGWSSETWLSFYTECAPHVKAVEDITSENENFVGNAMAKILKVLAYSRMTDYYGPIIYSQYGNNELTVPFDSQESIYMDFFDQLDDAVAILKVNPGANMFGQNDRIYGGSADKWLKFANSLRLRLAMHIRYADAAKARVEAEKAIEDGVFTDNNDNAILPLNRIRRHTYGILTGWSEFRMSAAMESVLKGYEDPRAPFYFSPAASGDTDGDGFVYEGLLNGQSQADLSSVISPNNFSNMGSAYKLRQNGGTEGPYEIMSASEIYFLRAEGALQGWNMGGSTKDMYEAGIRASLMSKAGSNEVVIGEYTNSFNTPVPYEAGANALSDIPVAFSSNPETQFEQIMTQKWIAIYPNGWEAWADLRRTGYPKLYDRLYSDNPDVGVSEIMRRITYPDLEADTNPIGYAEALTMPELAQGDKNSTKVWWDKK
ncbi:SusD/RagB family nutrient-binding outer membrane lipoprotein [Confluentibacter flavum]|nr:SusD/RagB family nutrient-binding outer membrane lipoprotein [Confluentibacter flavum]